MTDNYFTTVSPHTNNLGSFYINTEGTAAEWRVVGDCTNVYAASNYPSPIECYKHIEKNIEESEKRLETLTGVEKIIEKEIIKRLKNVLEELDNATRD